MLPLPLALTQQAEHRVQGQISPQDPLFAVLALSDFVADNLQQHPEWQQRLVDLPPLADEWQHYQQWLDQQSVPAETEAQVMRRLRLFRREMLVRIAWMQTLSIATTEQTLQQLSHLAELLIAAARDWCWQQCCQEMGTPTNAQGETQPLLVLGMGKLGGGELNFSSDIDLIFAWPENGSTVGGGRRELDNAQFFMRMGQRLIKLLDQPTIDGFVYRVDMRLRPFGDSGPLVLSFAALEDYYQEQGREWERYAMVKARLMGTAHSPYNEELQQLLRPFIYRRYIDFSAIQSLRTMKGKIHREVRRRGLKNNIKLGAGGIRECEFIVQVFQLIRGGRERALQTRSFLTALQSIETLGLLPREQAQALHSGYLFLRRLENLLQSIGDQQTQTLPEDDLNRQRLAWAMGMEQWSLLVSTLDRVMQEIHVIFVELIGEEEARTEEAPEHYTQHWWLEAPDLEELQGATPQLTAEQQQQLLTSLQHFQHDIKRRTVGPRGRQALDQLMPVILAEVCPRVDAAATFSRLAEVLLSVASRSTYLELFIQHPGALKHLVRLCAASPMVATELARHPLLLDELLDPQTLYQPAPNNSYREELREYLLRIPQEDEEQQVEALRQFKLTQQLRIAAADIAGTLPVMKVSDHLTWLAEALLEVVVWQAWQLMVQRYGRPNHLSAEQGPGFAVVGYGKLGGWELGYRSDLDLVFLHDCPADTVTTGERSIEGRQFYLKMAQRIIHLFSTRTASGILYEVDARLRPSGAAGMLVTTFEAFEDYQRQEAWTWEHQALVRARTVFGEPGLQQKFAQIRQSILCRPREVSQLTSEVTEMREKMLKHLGNKYLPYWDIKADQGGIVDIEFLAQYWVLRFAAEHPTLTRWSDNVRIVEMLAQQGILTEQTAQALTQAYITLRDALHHLALQGDNGVVDEQKFLAQRSVTQSTWQQWLVLDK